MRVCLLNDVSYPTGGATKVFLKCIAAAQSAGLDVVVFVGDDGEHIRRTFPGVRVVSLNEKPLRAGVKVADVFRKSFNIRAARLLREELAADPKNTVVHLHSWMQILSPSIFYAIRDSGCRLIVTAHDYFLSCPNGGFFDYATGEACSRQPLSMSCLGTNCDKRSYLQKLWRSQRTWLQQSIGQKFWSTVTVILVHEKMRDRLGDGRFGRLLTLRTPTDAFVSHKVDVSENRKITFLGRMVWEKGVDVLVDALQLIDRPAQLLGSGFLLEDIRRRAPTIYCPGWVEEKDVPKLLNEARVFVMPSSMPEPYGLVAVEAMMSGIPVVVSRHSLISQEVEASGAGLVFENGDAGSLAAALDRLTGDDVLATRMSERAYQIGKSFAPTVEQWEAAQVDIYREAVHGKELTGAHQNLLIPKASQPNGRQSTGASATGASVR